MFNQGHIFKPPVAPPSTFVATFRFGSPVPGLDAPWTEANFSGLSVPDPSPFRTLVIAAAGQANGIAVPTSLIVNGNTGSPISPFLTYGGGGFNLAGGFFMVSYPTGTDIDLTVIYPEEDSNGAVGVLGWSFEGATPQILDTDQGTAGGTGTSTITLTTVPINGFCIVVAAAVTSMAEGFPTNTTLRNFGQAGITRGQFGDLVPDGVTETFTNNPPGSQASLVAGVSFSPT